MLEAVEFGRDRVHIFVSNCKNHSVPKLVQKFKGASSRELRKHLWHRFRHKLRGESFWSDGHFCRSVGSTTDQAIQYYIKHSQRKHWRKPIKPEIDAQPKTQTSLAQFLT